MTTSRLSKQVSGVWANEWTDWANWLVSQNGVTRHGALWNNFVFFWNWLVVSIFVSYRSKVFHGTYPKLHKHTSQSSFSITNCFLFDLPLYNSFNETYRTNSKTFSEWGRKISFKRRQSLGNRTKAVAVVIGLKINATCAEYCWIINARFVVGYVNRSIGCATHHNILLAVCGFLNACCVAVASFEVRVFLWW